LTVIHDVDSEFEKPIIRRFSVVAAISGGRAIAVSFS